MDAISKEAIWVRTVASVTLVSLFSVETVALKATFTGAAVGANGPGPG